MNYTERTCKKILSITSSRDPFSYRLEDIKGQIKEHFPSMSDRRRFGMAIQVLKLTKGGKCEAYEMISRRVFTLSKMRLETIKVSTIENNVKTYYKMKKLHDKESK